MLKKEYEVLAPFVNKPWMKASFREIKNLTGKKSESYLYNSLKKYAKQNILREELTGNSVIYSLSLDSLKARNLLGYIAEHIAWSRKKIPYGDVEKLSKEIPTNFYTLIITGSYANNTQKKSSDIDVVIIADNSNETKKIYSTLRQFCELNIPKIHLYVFTASEFLQMLLSKEANYGKEIVKNSLLLSGAENYYSIINEAIENGFNDKKLS